MTAATQLGLGIIGAGGFAQFVASAAEEPTDDLAIVAVTDLDRTKATDLAKRHGAAVAGDVAELLADDRVRAVVVATPPNTHAELSIAALGAGRHVFCEKPTALRPQDADRVAATVQATRRCYVVDHVLRYNPILAALQRLRADGLLGPVQRFAFENDAADENLPERHWFWDDEISGGILLEHCVHFFDAAAMLIDAPPHTTQAIGGARPSGLVDTVACTVQHTNGTLASYAHGFSHAHRAERQLMRIDFGLGEARVHGWIPLRADLDVWTDRPDEFEQLPDRVAELFAVPGYRPSGRETLDVTLDRDAAPPHLRARGFDHTAPHHVAARLDLGWPDAKPRVYRESVRAALHDLAGCVRTGAAPHAGIEAGRAAVHIAAAASNALRTGRTQLLTPPNATPSPHRTPPPHPWKAEPLWHQPSEPDLAAKLGQALPADPEPALTNATDTRTHRRDRQASHLTAIGCRPPPGLTRKSAR